MKKSEKLRTVKVIESFQFSNSWNIIFIQGEIDFSGLRSGTVLKSSNSNKSWYVKNRIIESHSIQTIFENEKILNSFVKFSNIQKRTNAEKKAKELNEKNIFQYQVEPIFHDKKPMKDEVLEIVEYQDTINLEVLKILLRELKFHSENGKRQILSIGFITFEVSKMTNSKTTEVYNNLEFLITEEYIERISNNPLVYNLTEKGKLL